MIAAFDYRADHCPPRYSVDRYQKVPQGSGCNATG